jgi:SHS2 domain-containing protein
MRSAAAGFSLHPHTADIRLQVWAPTLQELFCIAAQGLAEVLVPEGCRRPAAPLRRWYRFAVHSPDETALLVDFLSMVLWQATSAELSSAAFAFWSLRRHLCRRA